MLLTAATASAQEKKYLTLQEAIDLSLKNSKSLKSNAAKIEEATAALREAVERKLPDATISGSYLRVNSPTVDVKMKQDNSGTPADNSSAKVSQAAYGLANVSLPIYAGSRIRYGIESSQYLAQAAKLDADYNREEVILNTVEAFNNLYKAKAAEALVSESLGQAKQRASDFSGLEKNGLLPRNDLLKAELQASNTELTLLDAQNNWKLANINMNLMLGLPEGTEIVLDSTAFNQTASIKSVEDFVLSGLQSRNDLSALNYRKKAAEVGIKSARAEKLPSVALTGGYVGLNVPNAITVYNAINIGVGVQYSISSLWKNEAKVMQARAKEKQLEAGEEALTDAIRLQINSAYQNYLLSRKKIDVYSKAVEQATENYRIVKNKFDNSLANTTDLLDAEVAQLSAKLNFAFAKSDAVVAYNRLLQSAGQLNNTIIK